VTQTVVVGFDENEHRYVTVSSEAPGLAVATETLEEFVEVVRDRTRDLEDVVLKFQEALGINEGSPSDLAALIANNRARRDETSYLLSSPRNAERLRRAAKETDAGAGIERELVRP
jgi:antitoxin YefM